MNEYIKRPKILAGDTIRMRCGCGNIYISLNYMDEQIVESFFHLGKTGTCGSSQLEALGRVISTALRSGTDPLLLAKQLKGIRCPSAIWDDGDQVTSCADAIGKAIEKECERLKTIKGLEQIVLDHVNHTSIVIEKSGEDREEVVVEQRLKEGGIV